MPPPRDPPPALLDAISRNPRSSFAWLQLGKWLEVNQDPQTAARQLDQAVRHVDDARPLLREMARLLARTPAHPLRISALNRLAGLTPDDAHVLAALGLALAETAAAPVAIKPLREAVRLGRMDAAILSTLATLEASQGNLGAAEEDFLRLLSLDPEHPVALVSLHHLALRRWRWDEARALEPFARAAVASRGRTGRTPRHLLLRLFGNDPPAPLPGQRPRVQPPKPPRPNGQRLRVGYLSADFRSHAVGYLTAGLFEQHDPDRVELFLYSYGPRSEDVYRQRIRAAAHEWRDLNDLTDEAAAARIRADRLDVLIEMTGHTFGGRLGICAWRPAPVQIHYLGFAGSLDAPGIDYYLADADTVPPAGEAEFTEQVLRLPRCFMVTDHRRALPRPMSRGTCSLPDEAIVLVNYNQPWKIDREHLEVWLRALARHPKTVLWLRTPSPEARASLLASASRAGVNDADRRIIDFGGSADDQEHLDRIALADLALDQLPYSSHSIGAELLWAGVPLLTQRGARFAGRVGASLVKAAGLPDYVTDSLEAYEQRLDHLLSNPDAILTAKRHLTQNRANLPLFDTKGFARDLEDLLLGLFDG